MAASEQMQQGHDRGAPVSARDSEYTVQLLSAELQPSQPSSEPDVSVYSLFQGLSEGEIMGICYDACSQ